jgi:histidinol-phosphate aminotransferase
MIPFFGDLNRLENRPIPFRPDWEIDVDQLVSSGAAITYVCAPNNPTATGVSRQAIEAVVERSRGLVIVDEAYAEYAETTAIDLVSRSDRLLVTRTLSKAFGLAGLRVGYGIGSPELIARLELARGPYKVTSIAETVAAAALDHDRDWVMDRVADTRAARARFEAAVAATSWELLPSAANFVLARPAPGSRDSVAALDARLRHDGIAGRRIDGLPWGSAMRLTIGPWEMMAPVVDLMAAEDPR